MELNPVNDFVRKKIGDVCSYFSKDQGKSFWIPS